MAKDQELLIKINGDARDFINEIDRINKKTKDLQAGLGKIAKASTVAFVALAGAVATTVVRFAAFEKNFTNVVTLLDKGSFKTKSLKDGIASLQKGIISLGATSGESFEVLNKGLFDLISGGVSADKALGVLESATQLATAGATDTATAVKALTATMTAFGDEAGTAQEISEKFFTAQKFGVTTVGELAKEFNKVGGIAKNLGISFDETLASLSSLTADGAKPTAEAATTLKAAFNGIILSQSKLKNESFAVRDALDLQNIKQRGLIASLDLFKNATGGSIVEMQKMLGSSEAVAAVLSLTGAQSELVATQIDEIGNASKRAATFQEAFAVKQATTEKALQRLGTSVDGIAVTFGAAFAPAINAAANALAAIAVSISEMDQKTVKTIATIVAITTAIVGMIAVLAGAALGYLKLKAVIIATNTTLGISTGLHKAYNFMLIAGRRVLALFRAGMIAATTTVRGFAAATGIGLLLVALSLAITHFKELKAIVAGSMAASGVIIKQFVKTASELLDSLGQVLSNVLTGNFKSAGAALDTLKADLSKGFASAGEASANAFNEAYDASIKATEEEDNGEAGIAKEREAEKQKGIADAKADAKADQKALDEAEAAEKAERIAEEDAADIQRILDLELTKDDIKKQFAKDELKKHILDKNQFLKDEMKFGTNIATFKKFMRDEEVKGVLNTNSQLARLATSSNSTLKGIGKAASLVQIGIKTAEGAISAYTSLSGIPIVGPALGAAAAGALIAFGGEQAAKVASAAQGGVVPNGLGGSRDRVPALLQPGELVVPSAIAPDFIQSVGRPEVNEDGQGGSGATEVVVGFKDEAFEIIEQKLLERRAIGSGGL